MKLLKSIWEKLWWSDPLIALPYQAIDHSIPDDYLPLESPLQQGSTWSYTVLANSAAVGPTGVTGPTGPTGYTMKKADLAWDLVWGDQTQPKKTETDEISEPTLTVDQLSVDPRKRKFYFE